MIPTRVGQTGGTGFVRLKNRNEAGKLYGM